MSRIGKLPIPLPEKVQVAVSEGLVKVLGPKGSLSCRVDPRLEIQVNNGSLLVRRREESRQAKALHGLTRQLVANMVQGVSQGFSRVLELSGVGYRAEVKGNTLQLTLGLAHPVTFSLPPGIEAKVERQTVITLEGADKQLLGETAAAIRRIRPPEPYKGKGIRYSGEALRRKAGKTAARG